MTLKPAISKEPASETPAVASVIRALSMTDFHFHDELWPQRGVFYSECTLPWPHQTANCPLSARLVLLLIGLQCRAPGARCPMVSNAVSKVRDYGRKDANRRQTVFRHDRAS